MPLDRDENKIIFGKFYKYLEEQNVFDNKEFNLEPAMRRLEDSKGCKLSRKSWDKLCIIWIGCMGDKINLHIHVKISDPKKDEYFKKELRKINHKKDIQDSSKLNLEIEHRYNSKIPLIKAIKDLPKQNDGIERLISHIYELIDVIDTINANYDGKENKKEEKVEEVEEMNTETNYNKAEEIWNILKDHNPQVILQGPPGSGKTYLAEEVIKFLTNDSNDKIDNYRIAKVGDSSLSQKSCPVIWDIVQFHPSYTYEDFVRGLVTVPDEKGVIFKVENRILAKACEIAEKNRDIHTPVILILDEINRADLSRILGELIYGLERDRRGKPVSSQYAYGTPPDNTLTVPPNLYLIGTMNTADRSIAMVDYAIRRRFAFLSILPDVKIVEEFYQKKSLHDGDEQIAEKIGNKISKLYKTIYDLFNSVKDADDIRIGHSYFLKKGNNLSLEQWADALAYRFAYEVVPMITEYQKERRLANTSDNISIDAQTFSLSLTRQEETQKEIKNWIEKE